jgi:hypothetical protein
MLTDCGVRDESIHDIFMRSENYADLEDYVGALAKVWDPDVANGVLQEILRQDNRTPTPRPILFRNQSDVGYSAAAFVKALPEPDFLTCIEGAHPLIRSMPARHSFAERANRLCERRGVPYRVEGSVLGIQFVWTGDAIVDKEAVAPGLSALDDPRLAQGPGREFAIARRELRKGTPSALKEAVAAASNGVESALEVLLTEHGRPLPARRGVGPLLRACSAANLFPPAVDGKGVPVEQILLGPARFGNRRGRRGSGPVPHPVAREEAEAVVAAAAVAIKFIAGRLPETPPASLGHA